MEDNSSATANSGPPILPSGLWWGALGVLAFSLTVPLTRIAVTGGLSPVFTGTGRAVIAGVLAALLLKEHVTLPTLLSGLLVIACATTAVRARNTPPRFHPVLEETP